VSKLPTGSRAKAEEITLNAVPYRVTEVDGQVIFEENSGFFGLFSRFVFEWRGQGWYLVGAESTFGHVFLPHIVSAAKWVAHNYIATFSEGKGVVRRRVSGDPAEGGFMGNLV
jgi:hypothetical protein